MLSPGSGRERRKFDELDLEVWGGKMRVRPTDTALHRSGTGMRPREHEEHNEECLMNRGGS